MIFLYRLLESCKFRRFKAVRGLIREGVNVRRTERGTKVTGLHKAAEGGDVRIIKLLLKNGASINAKDREGNTPLMWAIRSRERDAVEYLITRGANVMALNKIGSSCLVIATITGDNAIINLVQNRMEPLRD